MKILNEYKILLSESEHSDGVRGIAGYLNQFYKPVDVIGAIAEEFYSEQMIERVLDGEKISIDDMTKYVKSKFPNFSDNFMDEVISLWVKGEIPSTYVLKSNTPMYDS